MSEKRKEAAEISPPWNTGTKWSDDTKRKLSIKAKNRIKLQCNHCDKIADASNFGRWHGDSCRMKLA